MKYSFHPEAEKEFDEAIDYFEEIERGLGYDFAVEVYLAVERTTASETYKEAISKVIDDSSRTSQRSQ